MYQFLSELKNTHKIFIGDYDSYTIIKYNLMAEKLLIITKIALLAFDYILMPAAFFWQSETMKLLINYLEEPISRGIIIPVIRNYNCTTDINDYFEMRMDESNKLGDIEVFNQPEFASEIASQKNAKVVESLKNLNSFVYLDNTSIRDTFKADWENDLRYSFDINSMRFLLYQCNLSLKTTQDIIINLIDEKNNPQFSRASCVEKIKKLIPTGRMQQQLENRVTWIYLKSNAISYDSKFYYSINPYNSMLCDENLLMLLETFKLFGITEALLSQLTIKEILLIRDSPEYKHFISYYRELIKASGNRQNLIIEKIKQKIIFKMRSEKNISELYKILKFIQNGSNAIFISLLANHFSGSEINMPMFISTGSISLMTFIIRRFELLNKYAESSPFSSFKNYIIAEEYNNYFEKMIGDK